MIKVLPEKRIPEVSAQIWPLAQQPIHQFYPLFACEEDVADTITWALKSDAGRAYGYWRGRALEGACCLFVEEEKRYVLIIALYVWGNFIAAANAFFRMIEAEFPGYEIQAGIAGEHTRFAQRLLSAGFALTNDRVDLRRPLFATGQYSEAEGQDLTLLEGDSLGEYAALHDAWFSECGWRAAELEQSPNTWIVVTARRGGEIAGAIFVHFGAKTASVDAFRAVDEAMATALLREALQHCAQRADVYDEIRWMAPREEKPSIRAASKLGFVQTAHYTHYCRKA